MPILTWISRAERTLEEMLTDLILFSDKNILSFSIVDLSPLPRVTPSSARSTIITLVLDGLNEKWARAIEMLSRLEPLVHPSQNLVHHSKILVNPSLNLVHPILLLPGPPFEHG